MLKKIEQKTKTLKKTVIAACVLHNICIERGDLYDADESDSDDNPADENGGRNVLETGNSIRDTLKDYVWENHTLTIKQRFCYLCNLCQIKRISSSEIGLYVKHQQ